MNIWRNCSCCETVGALCSYWHESSSVGLKYPRQTEVPAWTEPAAGKRGKGSTSARSLCHCNSSAASIHPGDQNQEHDLQNQTQTGLHTSGLWCKVRRRVYLLISLHCSADQRHECKDVFSVQIDNGVSMQGEDCSWVHRGWAEGSRIWVSVHPCSRHVVLCREPRPK